MFKRNLQLKNVRYGTEKRAIVHFDMATLIYNTSKLAVDRIIKHLIKQVKVA